MALRSVVCGVACLACVVACGSKKDEGGGTPPPTEGATEPAAETPAVNKVDSKAKLKSARALAKEKKYAEAVVELEAVIGAEPENVDAHSELGWAAFKAGDFAKASAANEKVLELTEDEKKHGAALYNLGRIAEERMDVDAARDFYERSMSARPGNKTVKKRFERLNARAELVCDLQRTKEDICTCLINDVEEYSMDGRYDDDKPTCGPLGKKAFDGVQLWRVEIHEGMSGHYIVDDEGKGQYRVMGVLSRETTTGRIDETFELVSMTAKKAGKRKYLWVEHNAGAYWYHQGVSDESDFAMVTVCGLGDMEVCYVQLTRAHRQTEEMEDWRLEDMEEMEEMEDEDDAVKPKAEQVKPVATKPMKVLPVKPTSPPKDQPAAPSWDWEVTMELTSKPSVKVTKKSGKPPEWLLGQHTLP